MTSLEKGMILAPLQKFTNNVGSLGKIIVATGFEWLPKVQKIAHSGHTAPALLPWLVKLSSKKLQKTSQLSRYLLLAIVSNR